LRHDTSRPTAGCGRKLVRVLGASVGGRDADERQRRFGEDLAERAVEQLRRLDHHQQLTAAVEPLFVSGS
jgi:hypothetical protein